MRTRRAVTQVVTWQSAVADALVDGGVTVGAYVPDSRLQGVLARLADQGVALRCLTREEECVGYAAGRRMAGGRPVVLMQCSGLGNSMNVLGSLVVSYQIGIPLVISMRGTLGEGNPSQVPMGRATTQLLGSIGIQAFSVRDPEGTDARHVTRGVVTLAYESQHTAAVVLEPELGGGSEGT
ncbi:MAG: sulfopyruvate decarboxylase subunit alpha [Pseudonocardiaceae bacterium]|nr:sulfopyruvate decarboxylase subunit alpha [Pseudonocardiaceae bacterium]